ncbi:DUF6338 family protein [Novosphingobium sp. M1R2S20]|uniref:DUF6338 family protein n=1 Tax=Novosphingobium rhizovicinum TaxID=3228928 RepID=A0ABV3R8F5_9SPHN
MHGIVHREGLGKEAEMVDLPSASEITKLTGLLAPGIMILWVRDRFRDTVPPKLTDKTVSYAVVSVAYSAAAYPLFHVDGGLELPPWLWQLTLFFMLPLLVGFALVYFDQSERFYSLTERLGLRPVHHTPTAWDYTFRKRPQSFVLVHLNDGTVIAGAWVEGSFASSITGDRDVFISQMWQVGENGSWTIVDPP